MANLSLATMQSYKYLKAFKIHIYRVTQKMYTLFTHQYKGAVFIHFFGTTLYIGFFFVIKPSRCINSTNLFCHENLHVMKVTDKDVILRQFLGWGYINPKHNGMENIRFKFELMFYYKQVH
jgi:hypothetical protein